MLLRRLLRFSLPLKDNLRTRLVTALLMTANDHSLARTRHCMSWFVFYLCRSSAGVTLGRDAPTNALRFLEVEYFQFLLVA